MRIELKPILKILEEFHGRVNRAELLSDFFEISARAIESRIGVENKSHEEAYLAIVKKYTPGEIHKMAAVFSEIILIFEKCIDGEIEFADWLGELYMASETSSSKAGQFFTPFSLSSLCAGLTANDVINRISAGENVITIDEPSCGSGGMILAFVDAVGKQGVNYAEHIFVHAADIDARCVHMAYIQLSLSGVPAVIHRRDTLTMQTSDEWHTPALVFNWMKFKKYAEGC